jgi:hypothetical protein
MALLSFILVLSRSVAQTQAGITLFVYEYDPVNPLSTPITEFTYMVNEDNTGDPTPDPDCSPATNGSYPTGCEWPSLTPMASYSPIAAIGDEIDALPFLADGRYLVSVRANGYKLGGAHFQIANATGDNVIVELVPEPLPLSTIRVHAFLDNQPVDGEDAGAGIANSTIEPGLEGFRIVLGDTAGEVSVDWYNNPLCSQYTGGVPNVDGTNVIQGSGGVCYTDANGNVSIENMPRGKYEVIVVPPDGQENDWAQTTTIEGTHVIDAWVVEGDEGNSPREGFAQPAVWVGFVPKCNFGNTNDTCPGNDTAGSGSISGTVKTIIEWTPPFSPLQLGQPMYKPWIALSDIGGTDQQVFLGRGNPDGTFEVTGVPDGTYQMAIWDEPLDYIIGFRTVTIPEPAVCDNDANPQTVDMNRVPNGAVCDDLGGVGIPRWFGWTSGYVFIDDGLDENGVAQAGLTAGNGIRDCVDTNTYAQPDAIFGGGDWSGCERAMDGEPVGTRYRDGSIQFGTLTNNDGFYEFPEVKELEKYAVIEVGFGRYGRTGASLHNEFDPTTITSFEEGALTVQSLAWAAKRSWVDWGKFSYDALAGENGGISGIVFNAVTRNETDIRFAGAEDYEPGIPDVVLNLYVYDPNAPDGKGLHIMQAATDAWEQATGCDVTDSAGNSLPDPTLSGPLCIEVPNTSNEVKDGLFDGGYAFETGCFGGYAPNCVETPLMAGDYVVEVTPPPFYKVLEPGDENTSEGNELRPPGLLLPNFSPPPPPTPGCDINNTGGCSRRLVTLRNGRNAPADFFLLPDFLPGEVVPMPGRIYGFALDDLNIETNPNFIYYGEKRGIPNTPVGIRDFTGRLVVMTSSDPNGIFEVLLPSGIAANCPTPSGICPNVYKVVINDPGDPGNPTPNFNPNYQTLTFQFDVWPGKTTYADVATFPITAFTEFPNGQFNQPAVCIVPDTTPEVWVFDPPGGQTGDLITVYGANFDAGATVVTDGGFAVPTTVVDSGTLTFTVPAAGANGRYQLLIQNGNGQISANGITFHKIGPGYTPTILWVDVNAAPGGNGSQATPFNAIQTAIDAASDGTIIAVRPGVYYEDITLNKNVKLQGFGPGANDGFGSGGTVIDERFGTIGIEIGAANPGDFSAGFNPQIDGFRIINARDEQDIGGGLHVDVNGQNVEISNNVIQSNGGNIGGGIVIGQPYVGDNNNDNIRIHHNRVLNNGGFSRAGGIGIYNGADNYEIDHNDICGNYSGEYGGGISHFGLSHGGSIHHNNIYRNNAFDEGGGIMIAGEQINVGPGDPTTTGSGNLDIYNNLIQENMSNDDGGGIRLLQPWDYHITMVNNMVVNNVATDMGGGISMDDASDVEIVNNTIARNANTSTAEDSDGNAHAAGVNVETYSTVFATYLGVGSGFPDPVMFNNIICENQSYTYDTINGVLNTPPTLFDLEVFNGGGAQLDPRESLLTDTSGYDASNDLCGDLSVLFDTPYELALDAVGFNQEPNFVTVVIVTATLDGTLSGDYHLAGTGTVAEDNGVPVFAGVAAPCVDFDDETRGQHDIGADEAGGNPGACGGGGGGGPTFNLDLVSDLNVQAQAFADTTTEVVLIHTLHNTGNAGDAYSLTTMVTAPAGPGWSAAVEPTTTGTIPPGGETTVTVTLSVPAGVISGTVAMVETTAESLGQPGLTSSTTDTITFFTLPAVPAADVYLSRERNGVLGNLTGVRDHDIVGYVQATNSYVMVFDGSDVGVPNNRDLEAFDILANGSILMSFNNPGNLPGVGSFDDSDIILFTPTSLGDNTAGTFSLYLSGAAVGLTTNGEDIDGISLREEDQLLLSFIGNWNVPVNGPDGGPSVNGRDEDVLMYQMFDAGEPAAGGTFSLYLDGSAVGLANGNNEDVNGVAYEETDVLYLTTNANFSVPGLSGNNKDIFVCTATATGPVSACTFTLFFNGSANGMAANDRIDGFDLP